MGENTAVVKITGDASGYTSILKSLETNTTRTTQQIERSFTTAATRSADKMTSSMKNMENSINSMKAGLVAGLSLYGLETGIRSMVSAAMDSEKIGAKLEATWRATGRSVDISTSAVKTQAAEFSRMTGISRGLVVESEAVLAIYDNIASSSFPRVIEGAANLSVLLGSNLVDATRQLAFALNDPEDGLTKLRRTGIQFSESAKEQIHQFMRMGETAKAQDVILSSLESRIGGVARAVGDTGAAAIEKGVQSWEHLRKTIGLTILQGDAFHNVIAKFDEIEQTGELEQWAKAAGDGIESVLEKAEKIGNWAVEHRGFLETAFVSGGLILAAERTALLTTRIVEFTIAMRALGATTAFKVFFGNPVAMAVGVGVGAAALGTGYAGYEGYKYLKNNDLTGDKANIRDSIYRGLETQPTGTVAGVEATEKIYSFASKARAEMDKLNESIFNPPFTKENSLFDITNKGKATTSASDKYSEVLEEKRQGAIKKFQMLYSAGYAGEYDRVGIGELQKYNRGSLGSLGNYGKNQGGGLGQFGAENWNGIAAANRAEDLALQKEDTQKSVEIWKKMEQQKIENTMTGYTKKRALEEAEYDYENEELMKKYGEGSLAVEALGVLHAQKMLYIDKEMHSDMTRNAEMYGKKWAEILVGMAEASDWSFKKIANDFLHMAERMALEKVATSVLTAAFSAIGFADGGYTGSGSRNKVAGVVHADEYVIPSPVVNRMGVGYFDGLVQGYSGNTTNNSNRSNSSVVNNVNLSMHFTRDEKETMKRETDSQLALRISKLIRNDFLPQIITRRG